MKFDKTLVTIFSVFALATGGAGALIKNDYDGWKAQHPAEGFGDYAAARRGYGGFTSSSPVEYRIGVSTQGYMTGVLVPKSNPAVGIIIP